MLTVFDLCLLHKVVTIYAAVCTVRVSCSMCCLQLLVLLEQLLTVWCIQLHLLQVAHRVHWLLSKALWPLRSLQLPQVHWYPLHKHQVLLDQAPSLEQTVCHLVGTHRLCLLHPLVAVSNRVLQLHQYHHIFNRMALLAQVWLFMTSYSHAYILWVNNGWQRKEGARLVIGPVSIICHFP